MPEAAAHGWREDTGRIRGRQLQRLRHDLYFKGPGPCCCALCGHLLVLGSKRPNLSPYELVRDHIIPRSEGGTEDESNIQPLCQGCSDQKTREEAKRGAFRERTVRKFI